MRKPIILILALTFLAAFSSAKADDSIPPLPTGVSTPSTTKGGQVNLGLLSPLAGSSAKQDFYYDFEWNGKQVKQGGTEPKKSDSTGFFLSPSTPSTAKSPSFKLDLSNVIGSKGSATVANSALIQALGLDTIPLPLVDLGPGYSTIVTANGLLDGTQGTFDFGLERWSLPIPSLLNPPRDASYTGFFAPSLTYERGWGGKNGDASTGNANVRGFLGYAFGWKPSSVYSLDYSAASILKRFPTGQKMIDYIQAHPTTTTSSPEDQIVGYLANSLQPEEVQDTAKYTARVTTVMDKFVQANFLDPTWAIWWEDRMWYTAVGQNNGSSGYHNLSAVVLSFWKDHPSHKSRDQIQLRWENGTPYTGGPYLNQLIATLGWAF